MKRKNKKFQKRGQNSLNKLSLFQKNDGRHSKKCPLSVKNAPIVDYKNISLLKKIKKITKTPIVAIGGIDLKNYKKLLLNKANFLAISGYVWKNKKLKPLDAIKKLI